MGFSDPLNKATKELEAKLMFYAIGIGRQQESTIKWWFINVRPKDMLMACSYCWPTKKRNTLNGFYTGVNTVYISE